jgi:hypothetical protein
MVLPELRESCSSTRIESFNKAAGSLLFAFDPQAMMQAVKKNNTALRPRRDRKFAILRRSIRLA